jgi:hypothetical protein
MVYYLYFTKTKPERRNDMSENSIVSVQIGADYSHFSKRDKELLRKLMEIAPLVTTLYKKQVPEKGKSVSYPDGLTKEVFKTYLEQHPEQRAELESSYTVVRWVDQKLTAIPYSVFYLAELQKIVELLREAAKVCDHNDLKEFLLARAEAFETNDVVPSEYLWIKVDSAPIEITIGANEEYDDELWAVKRSFEMVLGVVLTKENQELQKYRSWAAEYDLELAAKYGYQPNSPKRTMVMIDEVSAGGSAFGTFVPQAFNLPNDTAIKQVAGSKQVFMRNIMEAKFNKITAIIAQRVVNTEVAERFTASDNIRAIVGHELAHGFGVYLKDGMREFGHMLEEAKADVFGIKLLYWLADRNLITKEEAQSSALAKTVDGLRQMRLGQAEAHAVGAVIQYRWMINCGAIKVENDKLMIDEVLLRNGHETLGDAFVELAATADYEKAKLFVEKWSQPIAELEPILAQLVTVPANIFPIFEE